MSQPTPCLSHLARLLGLDRDRLERLDAERLIAEAAREVGIPLPARSRTSPLLRP
jgi:hypothetical protein